MMFILGAYHVVVTPVACVCAFFYARAAGASMSIPAKLSVLLPMQNWMTSCLFIKLLLNVEQCPEHVTDARIWVPSIGFAMDLVRKVCAFVSWSYWYPIQSFAVYDVDDFGYVNYTTLTYKVSYDQPPQSPFEINGPRLCFFQIVDTLF